jgi:hypothetical protein
VEDQYTGDIGDFGKFGLLRELARQDPTMRFGLIWYLYPDELHRDDGKFVTYLSPSTKNKRHFHECDPDLYDRLKQLVDDGHRRVSFVPGAAILPASTVYFDERLNFPGAPAARPAAREAWLARALGATAECDMLLLDPDNGRECKVTRRRQSAGKYVYFDEIAPMVERGQTIILYQHLDRSDTAENQIAKRADRLEADLRLPVRPRALRYHRGSGRAYYFLTQARHERVVDRTIDAFTSGPWSQHFTLAR